MALVGEITYRHLRSERFDLCPNCRVANESSNFSVRVDEGFDDAKADRMVGSDDQDRHLKLAEDHSDDEEKSTSGEQPELILGEGGDISVVGGDASKDRDH